MNAQKECSTALLNHGGKALLNYKNVFFFSLLFLSLLYLSFSDLFFLETGHLRGKKKLKREGGHFAFHFVFSLFFFFVKFVFFFCLFVCLFVCLFEPPPLLFPFSHSESDTRSPLQKSRSFISEFFSLLCDSCS